MAPLLRTVSILTHLTRMVPHTTIPPPFTARFRRTPCATGVCCIPATAPAGPTPRGDNPAWRRTIVQTGTVGCLLATEPEFRGLVEISFGFGFLALVLVDRGAVVVGFGVVRVQPNGFSKV